CVRVGLGDEGLGFGLPVFGSAGRGVGELGVACAVGQWWNSSSSHRGVVGWRLYLCVRSVRSPLRWAAPSSSYLLRDLSRQDLSCMACHARLHLCMARRSPVLMACRPTGGTALRASGSTKAAASADAAAPMEVAPAIAVQPSTPPMQQSKPRIVAARPGSARKRFIFAPGDRVGHRENADRSHFGYGALRFAHSRSSIIRCVSVATPM